MSEQIERKSAIPLEIERGHWHGNREEKKGTVHPPTVSSSVNPPKRKKKKKKKNLQNQKEDEKLLAYNKSLFELLLPRLLSRRPPLPSRLLLTGDW